MQTREDVEQCAFKLKALTDKHRLMMLHELFRGERTVSALAAMAGIQITMASHHLSILLKAGIVTSVRKGRFVNYSVHPDVERTRDAQRIEVIDLGCCVVNFEQSLVPPPENLRQD